MFIARHIPNNPQPQRGDMTPFAPNMALELPRVFMPLLSSLFVRWLVFL